MYTSEGWQNNYCFQAAKGLKQALNVTWLGVLHLTSVNVTCLLKYI